MQKVSLGAQGRKLPRRFLLSPYGPYPSRALWMWRHYPIGRYGNRLRIDFPDDRSMRISHEAIYQALYVQGRGALRRELTACLRSGRALRVPRARVRGRGKSFVTEQIMISERPVEAEDRAVPGHWEGDLILGANQTAIGTLVERSTRFTMLLYLPPMPGHGGPRVKNGPPLAGRGAEAVRDAITAQITTLPEQLRRSLTWDQGAEMSQHAKITIASGLQVYFCDPQSSWQRGTNENTTACSANTSRKAQTSPDTPLRSSRRSLQPSIADHARPSPGAHPPKHSTSIYDPSKRKPLRAPIESAQFTSWAFSQKVRDAGLAPSMGAVGTPHDNAMVESFWGRMQVELLNRKRWQTASSSPQRSSTTSRTSTTTHAATAP
jgi:hypothetical protein